MNYEIHLIMDGDFPGAPDHDRYVVPESVYDLIKEYLEKMPGKHKLSDSSGHFS